MASVSRPDGTVLHYEDFNFAFPWEERGAPVVLVHGLGCNWTLWVKQLAWLVPDRRVIAADARGSGRLSDQRKACSEVVIYLGKNGALRHGYRDPLLLCS